jgi:hypothetical protein
MAFAQLTDFAQHLSRSTCICLNALVSMLALNVYFWPLSTGRLWLRDQDQDVAPVQRSDLDVDTLAPVVMPASCGSSGFLGQLGEP